MKYTKTTFLKKMRHRRKQLDSIFDKVMASGLENEKISEKWYFKDLVCHITWYDEELIKALENQSVIDSEFWNTSASQRNNMIFGETQDFSVDEIIGRSRLAFSKLTDIIEQLTDDQLNSDDYIKRKSDKRVTWDFVGAINFWHYEDHEDALIEYFDLDYM